jgi:hypothetical protein
MSNQISAIGISRGRGRTVALGQGTSVTKGYQGWREREEKLHRKRKEEHGSKKLPRDVLL